MSTQRRHAAGTAPALVAAGLAAAGAMGGLAGRRWSNRWGATDAEVSARLPGDELIGRPSLVTTRAVTIDAPPDDVWPWLVQMGQDRAGLYSYDWLERLVGLDFHNADRIVPEWQQLAIGDQLRMAPPSAGPQAGFTVVAIDPGRSLVTAVGDPAVVVPQTTAGSLTEGGTWAFLVEPDGSGGTRLIIRLRMRFGLPLVAELAATALLGPIHFLMERKQLLGIKARVEASSARSRQSSGTTATRVTVVNEQR